MSKQALHKWLEKKSHFSVCRLYKGSLGGVGCLAWGTGPPTRLLCSPLFPEALAPPLRPPEAAGLANPLLLLLVVSLVSVFILRSFSFYDFFRL